MSEKVYQIITDRIIELLKQGTVPWQRPWKSNMNLVSKKPYRGINTFLLAATRFESPFWVSFNQCKKIGGAIKSGAKATMVIFWKVYEKETEDDEGELKKNRRFVLRYYNVFNTDQCEGIKVPAIEEHDHEPIEVCETVVRDMPKRPEIRHGSNGAYYFPAEDSVSLPRLKAFTSPEEYYSTLFHELTHATGHVCRLGRHGTEGYASHRFGSPDYSREELVAEMGAAFLCGQCGIENRTINNSAAYVKSWMSRLSSEPHLVITAAAQAQKASDFILGTFQGDGGEEE